ncbi:MAG TPA: response regulator [Stellaceae bacterium]|nr:response regulator [Stellaceae bacterium]
MTEPRVPTILVVDDERVLRDLVAHVLATSGFRVLTASDGAEALSIIAAQPVDMLFTDIVMPSRSGVELAEQAKRLRPQIRVLFVTGYAQRATEQAALRLGRTLFKPVRVPEIVREVKALFAAA